MDQVATDADLLMEARKMIIKQIDKTLENVVKLASMPNAIFLKYGRKTVFTGERHLPRKPVNEEEKKRAVFLNYRMLDSMKISEMNEWIEDPNTALIIFEETEEG